jgi:ABC-type multidrug transport system fused ATPase/permease subunit
MKLKFKNNFFGYFNFYYGVTGNKILVYLALSITVGFLDGMGLAMFMPLLQAAGSNTTTSAASSGAQRQQSMGQLHYLTDAVQSLGFGLTLNVVLSVLVILFIVKGVLRFIQLNYGVNLRDSFMRNIRFTLVDNLQRLSYKGFLKLDAGRIQNTLIGEVQRLFQTMNFYFNAAQSVVLLLTYIALAFLANYKFAFLVAVGAGLSNFIYKKINVATKKASIQVSQKGHDFNSYLIQAVNYFKYLKSTGYFVNFKKKINHVITETEILNKKMGFYAAITTSTKEPLIMVVICAVIYIQLNWIGADLTSILLSLVLFYRALNYLSLVQTHWQSFIQNIGSMETVASISQEMGLMQEPQNPVMLKSFDKELHIKDVEFSYGPTKVLDKIDLHIPKNHTVAFVGESGSGKTTLANLIAGLIEPLEGEMRVDGTSLQSYNLDSYREKIGYISQEPVIFNDDIFNNITFWAERTPENLKRFEEIIELSSLNSFIEGQPQKELTKLGDNGILISGGQKQRISIARELYKKVDILILDEATSALDSETERIIKENIDKLHGSYTLIIIAHRISTIKNADTIYMLEKGKIAASGNFNEMIERSEQFKYIVSLQSFSDVNK